MRLRPQSIRTKRIYEDAGKEDGVRVLVDRIWPRGISKERAVLDAWMKDIAPSNALRKRFHNKDGDWNEFVSCYQKELEELGDQLDELEVLAAGRTLTLLFASRDTERNNAVALKKLMELRA